MSAFAATLDTLNDTALATFGGDVYVLLSDNTTLIVNGVFSRQRDDVEANVAASYRYTVQVKTADVQNFAVAKRNSVTIDGVVYTIIDITPDDGGMTTWVLKRYG